MEALADEQASLLAHAGALLINIGTLSLAAIAGMHAAVKAAGVHRTPVVLDPVAAGATPLRRALVVELLDTHGASVIKANAGEVAAVLGFAEVGMQGVDSVGAFANPVEAVVALSRMHRCVVAMTGVIDYVSNGDTTVAVRNGHAMQATVTGTCCLAGSAIATFVAFARDAPMLGALTGIVAVNLAAEHAARRPDVRGPGSFRPAFLDELHALTSEHILAEARIDMC
ncbi:thiamine biosynthetic bifunctional enzyme [Coemansia sp. RSA 2607]|nr:thiamine biosynthetic bifunctional enzyme [Coemansia sp. RSA 2607]KAJ2388342.1 thiamine biosynthetic bifunctional enzyme [Coemansia sp. RSA 2603]